MCVSIFEPTASSGNVLGDRYLIEEPIGSGASAQVFLAQDLRLGRRVAVKIMHEMHAGDSAFLKRFDAEAKAAAMLSHVNVMQVHDFGIEEGRPYLVLEFLGGGSLRAVLDKGGVLSPSQGLDVALGAARGLEYAHRHDLVHRDIKPANLLFGEDHRIRIADFGLARALAAAEWTEPIGKLLGTAKYASPEQAKGLELDGRSDVYSLALVILEACTGEVPFLRDTKEAMLSARIEPDLEVPRTLGRLAPVLAAAGRADREQRPTAGEFVVSLMAAAADMDPPAQISLPGAVPVDVLNARLEEAKNRSTADDVGDHTTEIVDLPLGEGAADGAPARLIDIPLDDSESHEVDAVEADDGTSSGGKSNKRLRIALVLLVLAAIVGGVAFWWFSIRIPTFEVPNVLGEDFEEASAQLEELGLEVDVTERRQDGTTIGEVLEQDPLEGRRLSEGESVTLVRSLGNTLVTFPDFSGADPIDENDFENVLELTGLVRGETKRINSEEVDAGFLISATSDEIDEDGKLPKGAAVDVEFSLGPVPRTIPSGLVGSTADSATKRLSELDLIVRRVEVFSNTEKAGTVVAVSEEANTEVPKSTEVIIDVSKGPEPIEIPSLTSKTGIQADEILRNLGFSVAGISGSPTGTVTRTVPAAGEKRQPNTSVEIFTE